MTDALPERAEGSLVRAIGVRALAANIINITMGAGIFVLPAAVAAGLGAAAPAANLVCALAMALVLLCFAEAGSRVSLIGGPYAYIRVALGPFAGSLGGVLLWLAGSLATAAVARAFADMVVAYWGTFVDPPPAAAVIVPVVAALAAVHHRYRTPAVAIAVQAAVADLLAITGGFEKIAILANGSVLVLYLFCCVATWVLRRRDLRSRGAAFRAPGGALVPALACAVIVWLLSSMAPPELLVVGCTLPAAAVLFLVTAPRRRAVADASQ